MDEHIVIAGPGRSGTTLLVQLLDALGFDTGAHSKKVDPRARAGLETSLLAPDAPRVVKNPALTWQLRPMIEAGQLDPRSIECAIVTLRSLDQVAASRIANSADQKDVEARGGLVGTARPRRQREWLAAVTYGLFETLARYEIPLILLEYPRFATDAAYAFRRLQPLLGDRRQEDFESTWRSVVDPHLVRSGDVELPRFAGAKIASARVKLWLSRKR